jgi:transposase
MLQNQRGLHRLRKSSLSDGGRSFLRGLIYPRSMRGDDQKQTAMFSHLTLAQRIPAGHPAGQIRVLVDRALERMDGELEKLYSDTGRPSIAPERLLRATLLMILFSIRGERLIEGAVSQRLLESVLVEARDHNLLSEEHFTVDGTLIQARGAPRTGLRPWGGRPGRRRAASRRSPIRPVQPPDPLHNQQVAVRNHPGNRARPPHAHNNLVQVRMRQRLSARDPDRRRAQPSQVIDPPFSHPQIGLTIVNPPKRKKRDGRFAVPLLLNLVLIARSYPLDNLNVLCLPALGTLGHIELNTLTLLQRTETVRLDGGVMNEDVLSVFTAKKSKTLGIIKPLDCALFHCVAPHTTDLPRMQCGSVACRR